MTTEDDFHATLDANPDDWQTRLVFADFLADRDDPRAEGYRAIAVQRRCPQRIGRPTGDAHWWYCGSDSAADNIIPRDWFERLPTGVGSKLFWPVIDKPGGVLSRRACEDALARAFAGLPADRRAALLEPPAGAAS